jgi:hypothetical protein
MKKSIKHIKHLIATAADRANDNDGGQSMKLTQAALNASNALAQIQNIKRLDKQT